ncbi:MAG TPA: hypothetical protein VGI60_00015 [Chthoniobacterales bacterium]|jgi:hypothetical protein
MPLDSLKDYERLGEHLAAIDSPLEAFAAAHRYTVIRRGHYPNRRITQEGPVVRSIHITMDIDEHGHRFDRFFPEIPYIVFGAAWIDDWAIHTRFSSPHIKTWAIPFSALQRHLTVYLHHFHSYLSALTEDCVRAYGTASQLASGPPVSEL